MIEQRFDKEAERAVLACMLESKLVRDQVRCVLRGRDFYEQAHETVWDAFGRLDAVGTVVDAVTLRAVLPATPVMIALLPELVTLPVVTAAVGHYAATVRDWSMRRQLEAEATRTLQAARDSSVEAAGLASTVATRFAALRDSGMAPDDVAARTLEEILADPDDEPDWLIPGLLERRDRLVLTGNEGLGKSFLLRQFAVCAAAGLHPWDFSRRFAPVRSFIWDCENTESQIRRASRGIAGYARHHGGAGMAGRMMVRCSGRIDIRRDKDLARIHHELDAQQPDLVVIGPLYKLCPVAVQTDDDAAPILAALDSIRDRGIAVLVEAHSGHEKDGRTRDMRPRGSSALLGWPEFGYGMRRSARAGFCEFTAWRGDRSERDWPRGLRRADDGVRWVPYDGPLDAGKWGAA